MTAISRRELLLSALALPSSSAAGDWESLFDGRSLNGWKASENAGSWKVVDGALAADGPRSHLFYEGPVKGAGFRNFELKAEVRTQPLANSGIYFHTRFQPSGWPTEGFEVQVNNSATGERGYRERKKTGSLYAVRNVYKAFAKDGEWFELHIAVRGKRVEIRLDGMPLVDYVEPDPPVQVDQAFPRTLGGGTFALQCHDPGSKAFYRNLRVRPLPDDAAAGVAQPVFDEIDRQLMLLGNQNFPVVDYHSHLKSGLELPQLLRHGWRHGIQYGVAINCGLGFSVRDDASALAFLRSMQGQPVFTAMQGEGREWVNLVSKQTIAAFDYVFTDSMTFTDDNGRRMRLWINEEVGEIPDRQRFMETYVNRTAGVLNKEPIDIYVNPTFLPAAIAEAYDELWTPERMGRVIEAAVKNGVAIEINNRYRLPGAAFIRAAKQAGAKFSFGTNNSDANVGRLEYCLEMVNQCGLKWQDMFVPKPDAEKAARRKG